MDHFEIRGGEMFAEDVPLSAIAEAVGTPVYVYSAGTLRRHARVFQQALSALDRPLVAFAVKANPNIAVLKLLGQEGLGADVVSEGEMRRALAAGIPADRIVFSGVGKTDPEMEAALEAGILQLNVESEGELERLSAVAARSGRTAEIALRVNPDVDARTLAKISTGKAENKFGIPLDRAEALYARAASLPGIRAVGVAAHIGSQLFDLAPLEAAYRKLGELVARLRAAGLTVSRVDLGGGLGIPYDPALPPPPSPADYGAMVKRVTDEWPDRAGIRLMFEPGRLIAGNAGVLLSRVVTVKEGAARRFVVLDAAMNDLIRPTLYGVYHDIRAVRPRPGETLATIVGPVCETGDMFAEDRRLTPLQEGDLVALMTAGAYGATMAGTYNSRPLVGEVLVDGSRQAVIRPRQTLEELLALDRVPDWL
ncbi:diaminopimelate decarboxylase [Sandaracinobacter sp. RS1-74]|uniref:diaminopimelate decarboxylase n=1 Tax=Sandaracinobacteroides sayramensis TaxID=2913411 RepID=UPI001EDAB7A1|nr:diaminopimelate decarboxylase [Sandaracinobacteroides sayramensis]MCG2841782.1 diaminopimelate decarboxylase [Sandaracinobacteroides sayramensis]